MLHNIIGTINVEIGNDPPGKSRSNVSKQCSGKYGYDMYDSTPNDTFEGSTKSSQRRSTGDSRKYDDFSSSPRPKMNFSYAAKDEEIADLQRELEQANKRAIMAQTEQRCV